VFALAIVGAEYSAWLPRGTHQWTKLPRRRANRFEAAACK